MSSWDPDERCARVNVCLIMALVRDVCIYWETCHLPPRKCESHSFFFNGIGVRGDEPMVGVGLRRFRFLNAAQLTPISIGAIE